ncbi:S-adenosyl-L-methionine-dependent methyltransferase [Syncephalis fuscata]|nr:S-adenosyl-L-methionine-dependent methyltransferase [Syncephalis fuscata]
MVLLRDTRRGKRTLAGPLKPQDHFNSHRGRIEHELINGKLPRSKIKSNNGAEYTAHHPTLEDYVLLANRHCTPIYPKDASAIIAMLDIHPGDKVLECGTGNGALTLYLARAIVNGIAYSDNGADNGCVVTVEKRESHAKQAQKFIGQYRRGCLLPWIQFNTGDLVTDIAQQWVPSSFDAIVLDMPDPSTPQVMQATRRLLRNDSRCICYLPNMTQVIETARGATELEGGGLTVERVVEVDWREWEVRATQPAWLRRLRKKDAEATKEQDTVAVKEQTPEVASAEATVLANTDTEQQDLWVCHPSHMPHGHTGFLVVLRKCESVKDEDL